MDELFPACITSLPEVDVSFSGVRGWLAQGATTQVVFFDIEASVDVPPHSHGEQWGIVVNGERAAAGLNALVLDDLACNVANAHALDLATGKFLSHWGSDGRKPYHRYSFAGGIDAVQENVSRADNIASVTPGGVSADLKD